MSNSANVEFIPLGKGQWMAVDLSNGPVDAKSASGGNKRDALENLKLRLAGKTPKNEKPHLALCKSCNTRAAETGEEKCAQDGVEVCLSCANKIDLWSEELSEWRKRMNQKKARRLRKARRNASTNRSRR